MRSSLLFTAGLAVALVAMASCGGGSYSAPAATAPTSTTTTSTTNSVTVSIVGSTGNQAFTPNPAMVSTGGTVVSKNNDTTMHHVVLDDGSADLGEIAPGATKSATLKGAGGNFHCVIHPTMVGSINGATAPTAPAPPCDIYGYGC
jgi:plastocyanin